MKLSAKKTPKLILALRWFGTLVNVALFFWLLTQQNWALALKKSGDITPGAFLWAAVLFIISVMFNTLRWCILLWAQDVKIDFWRALEIVWAGNFASNFLPSTVGGDGFRMLAIFPVAGRKTLAVGSVMLDRLTNMASMLILTPLPLWMFSALWANFTLQSSVALLASPKRLFEKYAPKFFNAYKIWSSRPQALFYAFLAAMPSNLIFTLAILALARGLHLPVSFLQVLSVQTATYFLSLLPISVNGYGLRELTYTALYTALGVSTEQASALALVSRLLIILTTLPGALWLSKIGAELPHGALEQELNEENQIL